MKKKQNPEQPSGRGSTASGGYAVRFRLQIHAGFAAMSSEDVWLERIVTLPIPPCIGLEVSDGDWSSKIENLYLPIERGMVEAWSEDKTIYDAQLRHEKHPPIDEIIKEYTDSGWKQERHNAPNGNP